MKPEVQLWGRTIGAVSLDDGEGVARFQYDPEFALEAGLPGDQMESIRRTFRLQF